MNTRIAAITATVLLAITLTGCGEDTTATDAQPKSLMQEAPSDAEATDSEAALSAEDVRFLEVVRGELLFDSGITEASDDTLIAAGYEACELVKAGTPLESLRLVEGEKPATSGYYMDTSAILFGAQQVYCPETIEDVD